MRLASERGINTVCKLNQFQNRVRISNTRHAQQEQLELNSKIQEQLTQAQKANGESQQEIETLKQDFNVRMEDSQQQVDMLEEQV